MIGRARLPTLALAALLGACATGDNAYRASVSAQRAGDLDLARSRAEEASREKPSARNLTWLGELELEQGAFKEAQSTFERALEQQPGDARLRERRAMAMWNSLDPRRMSEAQDELQNLLHELAADPLLPEVQCAWSRVLQHADDPQGAAAMASKACNNGYQGCCLFERRVPPWREAPPLR